MAQTAMVTNYLTDQMIEAGKTVLEQLDASNVDVSAALWLLEPESQSWRLVLAIREVDRQGPKAVYKKIDAALQRTAKGKTSLSLQDISAVSPKDAVITLLRKVVKTEKDPGLRFSRNTINGHYIEDAYIYRPR